MPKHNPESNFDQVLPHLTAAYNLARRLTRNQQDAEDVVQEACLRAVRFSPGLRGGDARAWLMMVVRNTFYSWLHANGPRQDVTEFDDDPPDSRAPDPEELTLQSDRGDLLRRALEMLPPNFREVLVLREIEEMSYKEIAEITRLPAGTVMSGLSRARGRLRQVLADLLEAGRTRAAGAKQMRNVAGPSRQRVSPLCAASLKLETRRRILGDRTLWTNHTWERVVNDMR